MLTDEQFKRGVENCDGQVKPWCQNQLVDGRVYMHKGACAQLAAAWMRNEKFMALGQQVPGRQDTTEEVSWMCEQKNKGKDVIDEFLRANGLRKDSGQILFSRHFNLTAVMHFIRAQKAYYFMGSVGGDSGHGIAFNTCKPIPSMFDPNYGEARFRSLDGLERLFLAFWPRAYPDLQSQGLVQRYR
ncbi:MAG: hypothetical protein AB7I35_10030 [Ramlibacter sp.]|nr:hypothetical protein [Ramlibacter sp.]